MLNTPSLLLCLSFYLVRGSIRSIQLVRAWAIVLSPTPEARGVWDVSVDVPEGYDGRWGTLLRECGGLWIVDVPHGVELGQDSAVAIASLDAGLVPQVIAEVWVPEAVDGEWWCGYVDEEGELHPMGRYPSLAAALASVAFTMGMGEYPGYPNGTIDSMISDALRIPLAVDVDRDIHSIKGRLGLAGPHNLRGEFVAGLVDPTNVSRSELRRFVGRSDGALGSD